MLSVSQIKAARSLLGWTASKLADESGVGIATIRRCELQSGIPSANTKSLKSIEDALINAGIEFIGDPIKDPGVKLKAK